MKKKVSCVIRLMVSFLNVFLLPNVVLLVCYAVAGGIAMSEATRRRLKARAPLKGKGQTFQPKQSSKPSEKVTADGTEVDRRRQQRGEEAECIREAYAQVTGKRVITGAIDVMPPPKMPQLLN